MKATQRQLGVASDFSNLKLGDARLDRRAGAIVERLEAKPGAPFPIALGSEADLEGFYRFIANPKVTFENLLQPHVDATARRMAGAKEVLLVQDTTEIKYGGERDGLGALQKSGRGYLAHVSLALPLDELAVPYGVLGVDAWARTERSNTKRIRSKEITYAEARDLPNEQERWFGAVIGAESIARKPKQLIHVMDSEADDYELFADLAETDCRFVIRLFRDRCLAQAVPSDPRKLKQVVAARPVVSEREVTLSKRYRGAGSPRKRSVVREQRDATLSIRAGIVTLKRPTSLLRAPRTLTLNFVSVTEENPPKGTVPVEWLLATTEPVDTEKQILKVVDIYRARWRVEEFFKALKTGCAIEKRQLETSRTLLNALALLIPVAWNLLRLRTVARAAEPSSANTVLLPEQLEVLTRASIQRRRPMPSNPTARDALMAIARLGGHLKSNGDPGWILLGRGYHDLLLLIAGYRLATGNLVIDG